MARPLRLQFEGAVYHVMSRGSERGSVFRDDADRKSFLDLLAIIVRDFRWNLHGYCLLGNHYHLLLETPFPNLSACMQLLNGRYTQRFNRRHRRSGHLLEGRFKAVLLEKEAHLLELHRYVVLNPVRAGIVRGPGDWRWSNYRATAGLMQAPDWLEVDWTLSQFAPSRALAQESYRRFVAAGRNLPSPLENVSGQIYLGSDRFLSAMRKRLEGKRMADEIPLSQRRPAFLSVQEVCRAVAAEWNTEPGRLSRSRGGDDKMAAIYLARKLTGRKARDVAEAFGVGPARVSNIIAEIDSGERKGLRERVEALRGRLAARHSVK